MTARYSEDVTNAEHIKPVLFNDAMSAGRNLTSVAHIVEGLSETRLLLDRFVSQDPEAVDGAAAIDAAVGALATALAKYQQEVDGTPAAQTLPRLV